VASLRSNSCRAPPGRARPAAETNSTPSRQKLAGRPEVAAFHDAARDRSSRADGTLDQLPRRHAMKRKGTRELVQSLIVSLLPAGAAIAGPVNVNTADTGTIAKELDGIGPAKAQAIVEYRQKNGPFRTLEDLLKVEGIGQHVLDMNRGNIRLDKAAAAAPAAKPATKVPGKH
jgi:competence protein ComEA